MADPTGVELTKTQFIAETFPLMELSKARSILEVISKTPEDQLANLSDFSQIGQYGINDIRDAFLAVVVDLQKKASERIIKGRESIIPKHVSGGNVAQISMYMHSEVGNPNTYPKSLEISILPNRIPSRRLSFELPIVDYGPDEDVLVTTTHGFFDFRTESSESAGSGDLQKHFTEEKFKLYLKGMRWFAQNALSWNEEGFILPEDIDKAKTSPSQ